jgi:hypothetical protein
LCARKSHVPADVNDAALVIARAKRFKDPEAELRGRIDLHRAHARVFQQKAAEQLALAQTLEDAGKKAEPPAHG